jgi:hypothetical protein
MRLSPLWPVSLLKPSSGWWFYESPPENEGVEECAGLQHSSSPTPSAKLRLEVVLGQAIPSFKNHKRAVQRSDGTLKTITRKDIKKRMTELETAIVSALYSECQTIGSGTASECLRAWRIALSGLCDDSLNQVPEFSFSVEYVDEASQGVVIEIEKLPDTKG